MVEISLDNAPELKSVGKAIEAQDIQLAELKRRYYLPLFFADASYQEQISNEGDGSASPLGDFYTFRIVASYPIYEGGRKRSDVGKATSEREGFERERSLVEELVERQTRTALQRCEKSFPRIKFARQSATAAAENLDLVQDKYAEGAVNVTDLLDAQNQKFRADQLATAAVYEFFIDLIELQRAISFFQEEQSPEEQDHLVGQILSAVGSR